MRLIFHFYRTFLQLLLTYNVPVSCCNDDLLHMDLNGVLVPGDILLGAVIPIHIDRNSSLATYQERPSQDICIMFRIELYQHFQALSFAVEEINRNPTILPNRTLGFYVYNTCADLQREMRGTFSILTGQSQAIPNYCCRKYPPLAAIIGLSKSSYSILMAHVLGLYKLPQISYYSTSSLLSDRTLFPSFFRTVPSDAFQFRGLAKLALRFNWTWVGLIAINDDYGNEAIKTIKEEIIKGEACVAYTLYITYNPVSQTITKIVNIIKGSSANVVVAISVDVYLVPLMEEMLKQNVTGKNFVASEAWSISTLLSLAKYSPIVSGTIGFAFQSSEIPRFQKYLNSINPLNSPGLTWTQMLWEQTFGCTFSDPTNQTFKMNNSKNTCTGEESLEGIQNGYNDVSRLRASYNIYTAVYVIATALHGLRQCRFLGGPLFGDECSKIENFKPYQVK
eukprot:XP_012815742.1 PREDICTED: extracellular calcium-sensing receptor-like [Xenopus tropicalis]